MTDKAIVRGRQGAASADAADALGASADVEVQHDLGDAQLVVGGRAQLDALAASGARVKLLPNTNLIRFYDQVVDIESADMLENVPSRRRVPRAEQGAWPHHVVQLDGPPIASWVGDIEALGVEVVEPVGAYGLFVVGTPDQMRAVADLPFVAWAGPFEPAWRISPTMAAARGRVPVLVGVYPPERLDDVRGVIEASGGTIDGVRTTEPGQARAGIAARVAIIRATIDAGSARDEVARSPWVRFLELDEPVDVEDERSAQIIAESFAPGGGVPAPVTGYTARLTDVGIDGTGVTIAIVDSGIDNHTNATMHADLQGRLAFFVDQTSGAATTDVNGHGTHVASIAAGDGGTGDTDPGGFLLGLGVAPGARVGSLNVLGAGGAAIDFPDQVANAITNGARVMNNSWGGSANNEGYVSQAADVDAGVRDPDPATARHERIVVVFSAGNNGGFARTITRPHECKNAIVVGNSLNARPGELFVADDARGMSPSSSRGPAVDDRLLPMVVAPGTDIVAARSSIDADLATPGVQPNRAAYVDTAGSTHAQHTAMTGTSMAAPHVSGLCALLVESWQARTGQMPSAALVKALLVNTAEDLGGGPNWRQLRAVWSATATAGTFALSGQGVVPSQLAELSATGWTTLTQVANAGAVTNLGDWAYTAGTDTITVRTTTGGQPFTSGSTNVFIAGLETAPLANVPNSDQGWGRVSFDNLFLAAPDSDRGPRVVIDERLGFSANGQEWTIRVAPVDPTRPMRITLAWTDAPGAAGANPALQNDLDLEVVEHDTGNVYRGNVFANGFSTTGGTFDTLNNVECVYVQAPSGPYDVNVVAGTLRADARPPFSTVAPWQDFAIVLDNAEVPATQPVHVALAVDRSGSMQSSGYVDVTRTAARSFLDLMAIDDGVGIASFGSSAVDEFPATAPPSTRVIAGQSDRDDAGAAVDAIAFGGSTMMGPGLQTAADMLPTVAGRKAVVLLSDGFDNGSPDARTVAGGLPSDVAVYSCAMGPLSDQTLLEDIADATSGRYLYMPTIDDLFLVLNVIREQITGDGLVVNERHTASASRVGAWVEASATQATFLVNVADTSLRWVAGDPKRAGEIQVRLRLPNGKLLHALDPAVRRFEGPGYVAFRIEEPLPGQWWVEVATARSRHTPYAVGGFVRSPLRLDVTITPRRPLRTTPIDVRVDVSDGHRGVRDLVATSCLTVPTSSPGRLATDFGRRLRTLDEVRVVRRDAVPEPFRPAVTLDLALRKEGRAAIAHRTTCVPMKAPVSTTPGSGGGTVTVPGGGGGVVTVPVGGGVGSVVVAPAGVTTLDAATADASGLIGGRVLGELLAARVLPGVALSPAVAALLTAPTTLTATHPGSPHVGSVNATVTVQGTTWSGERFVRTTTRSTRVG